MDFSGLGLDSSAEEVHRARQTAMTSAFRNLGAGDGWKPLASPPAIRRPATARAATVMVGPTSMACSRPPGMQGCQFRLPRHALRDTEDSPCAPSSRPRNWRGNVVTLPSSQTWNATSARRCHVRASTCARKTGRILAGSSTNSPVPRAANTRTVIIDAGRTECRFRNTRTTQETAVSGVFSPKRWRRPRGTAEDAVAPRKRAPQRSIQNRFSVSRHSHLKARLGQASRNLVKTSQRPLAALAQRVHNHIISLIDGLFPVHHMKREVGGQTATFRSGQVFHCQQYSFESGHRSWSGNHGPTEVIKCVPI